MCIRDSFRALWDCKLQDMEESKMDMPSDTTLYRRYLSKINPEMRVRILQKEWKIDGPESPPRNPRTHQDVAIAAGLLLEEKADIYATGTVADSFMFLDGNPQGKIKVPTAGKGGGKSMQCNYCQALNSHHSSMCPQKAADTRGDTEGCKARHSRTGVVCNFCQSPNHEQKHQKKFQYFCILL